MYVVTTSDERYLSILNNQNLNSVDWICFQKRNGNLYITNINKNLINCSHQLVGKSIPVVNALVVGDANVGKSCMMMRMIKYVLKFQFQLTHDQY